MKKVLLAIMTVLILASCTEQWRTRELGGSSELRLEKGQRLVELTWKDDNLWILTEPMDSDYIQKTKTFYEESSFGVWEGKVTIIESR